MPKVSAQHERSSNGLRLRAFLYVHGELHKSDELSFERRLALEQAARDALCQAVLLCQPLRRQAGAGPDPGYRERVRQRLRFQRRCPRLAEEVS